MGNQANKQSYQNRTEEVVEPRSMLNDVILTKVIYLSDAAKVFKAYNPHLKEEITLHVFPQGLLNTIQNKDGLLVMNQTWDKQISSFRGLKHPWILKLITHKISEKYKGLLNQTNVLVASEEYTTTVDEMLKPLVMPSSYEKRGRSSSFHQPIGSIEKGMGLKRTNSEARIVEQNMFEEKMILKMLFTVIDALVYCSERGGSLEVCESSIVYCKNSNKFMVSPFSLIKPKDNFLYKKIKSDVDDKENKKKRRGSRKTSEVEIDEDDYLYKQTLCLKKQIFNTGLIALKMASLLNVPKDLKSIKKALVDIKGQFPNVYGVLKTIFFDIFRDKFDIKGLLTHKLYDNVYYNVVYCAPKQSREFLDQGLIEQGKVYNMLENHRSSLLSFQKGLSDYIKKEQEMPMRDKVTFAEISTLAGESYIETGLTQEGRNYLEKSEKLYDKIYNEGAQINFAEGYCEIAKLYRKIGDLKKVIPLFEKASQCCYALYEKKNGELDQEYWLELEEETLKLKEKFYGKESSDYKACLENLAELYTRLGEVETALEYRKQLVKMYEANTAKFEQELIKNVWLLAELNIELGEYSEAMKAHKRCRSLRVNKFGNCNMQTLESVIRIGRVHELKEEYLKAIKWYKRALDTIDKFTTEETTKRIHLTEAVGRCYKRIGEMQEASEWYGATVEMLENHEMERSMIYANKVYDFAAILEMKEDYETASENYRKCMEALNGGNFNDRQLYDDAEQHFRRVTQFIN